MRPIKVLGICGSPRKGNSFFLLEKALAAGRDVRPDQVVTSIYSIKGKIFQPCIACSHCSNHSGDCVHKDDFGELRDLWMQSDVIIYSVPVYHMGIPGQLKCFIDRLGNSMFGKYRAQLPLGRESLPKLFKVIGAIAQGIHIFSGQEHTITDLINHALIMQSVPVTGDLWESYIGSGAWTSNRGEKDALEKLADLGEKCATAAVHGSQAIGRRAVEMALIIRAGLMACKGELERDPLYRPLLSGLE